MTDTKHTPGPWTIDERDYAGVKWDAIIRNRDNDPVACVGMAGYAQNTSEANARLIAAAPDMLEELRDALAALEANFVEPKLQETIRQTIAKATGDPPQ